MNSCINTCKWCLFNGLYNKEARVQLHRLTGTEKILCMPQGYVLGPVPPIQAIFVHCFASVELTFVLLWVINKTSLARAIVTMVIPINWDFPSTTLEIICTNTVVCFNNASCIFLNTPHQNFVFALFSFFLFALFIGKILDSKEGCFNNHKIIDNLDCEWHEILATIFIGGGTSVQTHLKCGEMLIFMK